MTAPYQPPSGPAGRVRRLAARFAARDPLDYRLSRSLVSFSFDDAPKSAATTGAAMLEAHGWRATYYIASGFEGGVTHLGAMHDADDLVRLAAVGHEIGCHTFTHADAAGQPADTTTEDCARNRVRLAELGVPAPRTFAFPYGEASPDAKRALRGQYAALRGVRHGVNRSGMDRALLKAVALDGEAAGLDAALDAVLDAAHRPGWLIFYGHDVRETPSRWGCTPEFLETVCDAVASCGLEVVTVANALARIEAAA